MNTPQITILAPRLPIENEDEAYLRMRLRQSWKFNSRGDVRPSWQLKLIEVIPLATWHLGFPQKKLNFKLGLYDSYGNWNEEKFQEILEVGPTLQI